MIDEHGHEHEHDDEGMELELDVQSRIFLEMRAQNIELLKIAAEVAGRGPSPPKPHEARQSLKAIWELYSEFYSWVDPEESEGDEGEDEE